VEILADIVAKNFAKIAVEILAKFLVYIFTKNFAKFCEIFRKF